MTPSVFIIAEAGVNHNGSLEMAFQLIEAAAKAGADAIKFQTFKAERMISRLAPKAEYQSITTDTAETQLEMVRKLELDEAAHRALIERSNKYGLQFLSTPFDLESIDLLSNTLNLPKLKLPSGEITNGPYLLAAAHTGKPVILSTGMSTLGEVETALGILAFGYTRLGEMPNLSAFREAYYSENCRKVLQEKVTLLHCTTEYPAPFEDVNLKAMDTLFHAFGLKVGFSDHTTGIAIPIAAVARGASIIEKHFTLDRSLPGPDHKASLEPDELTNMIKAIRQVEIALGQSIKSPSKSEIKNISVARKSIVAARNILKGEILSEENLAFKRPGNGVSPIHYWELIGKQAIKDFNQDEVVET